VTQYRALSASGVLTEEMHTSRAGRTFRRVENSLRRVARGGFDSRPNVNHPELEADGILHRSKCRRFNANIGHSQIDG